MLLLFFNFEYTEWTHCDIERSKVEVITKYIPHILKNWIFSHIVIYKGWRSGDSNEKSRKETIMVRTLKQMLKTSEAKF